MEVMTNHFTHSTKSLGSKYDMDTYMATFLGGEARGLCWELGQAKS
jgi:hypothetical protein